MTDPRIEILARELESFRFRSGALDYEATRILAKLDAAQWRSVYTDPPPKEGE